ncbi:hypothetical protein ACOMHN_016115 [Nucella lapillus]
MLRFAALNHESDSGEEEDQEDQDEPTTKEAEEAQAFSLYNRALGLQRSGDGEGAEQLFSNLLQHPFILKLFSSLLNHPFIFKAQQTVETEQEDSHHPALPLLYLVHKNMAASAVAKGNFMEAMKSYLEAVKIDSSEVTVWYKMGTVAKQIHNYPLAKLAFEQGLHCNERHWPSLDAVITVLYALNDYAMCLEYCGRGLERDPYYTKGLVFSRQILKEQPSLVADTKELFAYCDPIIHTVSVDADEAEKMIKECTDIRDKRREMARKPDPPVLKLPTPITQLAWKCVGECLVELFDNFTTSNPTKSLVLPLDMKEYIAMAEGRADHPEDPTTAASRTPPTTAASTPPSSSIATAATTTTTTNGTTSATVTSPADKGSAPNMEMKSTTTITQSAQPAPTISVLAAPQAVSGATRDLAEQGEQPMEVDRPGIVHSGDGDCLGSVPSGDKAMMVMEAAESCETKPASGASGKGIVNEVSASQTVAEEKERMDVEESGNTEVAEKQGTSSKLAELPQSVSESSKGEKDSSHKPSAPAPSCVTGGKEAEGVQSSMLPSSSTSLGTSHTHAVSDAVGQNSGPALMMSERGEVRTSQASSEASPSKDSSAVKSSASVPSESATSVTSGSGSGAVATGSSSATSVTSSRVSSVVSKAESVRTVVEGKEPSTVSSTPEGSSLPAVCVGGGVEMGEKNQNVGEKSQTVGESSSVSRPLSVDVRLAAKTATVLLTSPSVTPLPSVTVTGVSAVSVSVPSDDGGGVGCDDVTAASVAVAADSRQSSPAKITSTNRSPAPPNVSEPPPSSTPPTSSTTTTTTLPPSTTTTTTTTPLPSPSGLGRPSTSPNLPKFQFNTITPLEVQALLQDCVPSTPLLSTPAPSSYSSSLLERFKQSSALSSSSASTTTTTAATKPTSTTTAAVASRLSGGVSSGGPAASAEGVGVSGEGGGEGGEKIVAELSPSKQQESTVSAEVALQDHAGLGRGSRANRRGTKRKRAPAEKRTSAIGPEDYGIKRRSARVRNTRKEEETVNFQKILHNFLPASLTQPVQEEEETQAEETVTPSQLPADVTTSELCGGAPLEETEREEVRIYLKECVRRQGVVGLMYKYLVHLSAKDTRLWPAGLSDLYLKVYERARDHLTFPSLYWCVSDVAVSFTSMDFPEVCYTELARMALVWSELVLDGFLMKRADTVISPVTAQRQGGGESGPSDSGLFTDPHAEEDLLYLTGMVESGLVDLFGEQQTQFAIRVYWMKGRLALAENQMDTALETLDWVGDYLREENGVTKVFLPNCQVDRTVSLEEVKRQQESLKRCQSLEECQRLCDQGQYQQVVESLTATCLLPHATHRVFKPALPERHSQLELLQDALYQQEDWGHCLLWGEVVMDEALHHYRRAPTLATRDSWALTLVHLLEGLQRVLDREANAMQLLPMRSLARLTQNLIRIIEVNHDVSEAVTEMPIASVLPWMLLYKIIRQEEDKNKVESVKMTEGEGEEEGEGGSSPSFPNPTTPSSIMLLSVAHEYLGRNAWCTRECGIFLQFCMDSLAMELPKAHPSVKDDLKTAFEQCVFCLYSHPNKKGRARHLVDHNAPCIELMWEHCEAVFEYFKPKTLPEFDSYKTSTVSGELHNLLRRIYALIPDTEDLSHQVTQVNNYIEGNNSTAPNFSSSCIILKGLYYLLADYYFKNKEQTKAIRFYTYDVCFNSERFDSWAGLALAKMYQLEQKLNSMELKIDSPVHKKSIAALRCFSRAVEIDEGVRKLWIEYGSLAYQLHSHASRQLRMKLWFPLTPELLDIAMETRVEMLATARNCYWKASKCEAEGSEEEWLHHYMMGKVMEKQRAHPRLYLEHYKQAAIYLHEEEAKYPRKILYNFTSPHLSLEALEMYYRLHVAVMKHLLRISCPEAKDDMVLFDRYLSEATESPFALHKEKHHETQESVSSADDSQCSVISIPPYSTAHQKPVYHMTPQDHNYSKQKSSGGETSDASCEVKETTGTETDGSQSSEETDAAARKGAAAGCPTSSEADTDTGEKRGGSSEGVGRTRRQQQQQQQEDWQMDMVELHAETDSQVSGQLPDTRPLFYDKQPSGGFIPHLDKYPSLVGAPSPSTTTTTTSTSTSSTITSTNSPATDVTSSSQDVRPEGEEKPLLLLTDKAKRRADVETPGHQRERKDQAHTEGSLASARSDSHPSTSISRSKELAQRAEQQNAKASRETSKSSIAKDTDTSLNSQSSVNIVSSAEDHSQDESLVSTAMPEPSIPDAVQPADELLSSPLKRPSGESAEQPSKRAKLGDNQTGSFISEKSLEEAGPLLEGTKERDQGQPTSMKVSSDPVMVTSKAATVTSQTVKVTSQTAKMTSETAKVTSQTVKMTSQTAKMTSQTAKMTSQTPKTMEVAPQKSSAETSVMEVDDGVDPKQEAPHYLPHAGSPPSRHPASDTQRPSVVEGVPLKLEVPESPDNRAPATELMDTSGPDSVRGEISGAAEEGIIKKEVEEDDVEMKEPDSSPLLGPWSREDDAFTQPADQRVDSKEEEKPVGASVQKGTPAPEVSTVHPSTTSSSSKDIPEHPPTPSGGSDQEKCAARELKVAASLAQGTSNVPTPSASLAPTAEVPTEDSDRSAQKACPVSLMKQETEPFVSSAADPEKDEVSVTSLPEQKPDVAELHAQPNSSSATTAGQKSLLTTKPSEEKNSPSTDRPEQKRTNPLEQKTTNPSEQKAAAASLTERKTSASTSQQKTPTEPSEERKSKDAPEQTTLSPVYPRLSSEDPKPSTADPKPSTADPKPSTVDPKPSTADPKPSTADPKPSTADPKPSTADPKPSTADPQPSTADPKPSRADPKPSTADPQPSTADPKPSRADPKPSTADPKPSTADPKPSTADPKPSTADPKPSTADPKPSTADPKPSKPSREDPKLSPKDPKVSDPKPSDPKPSTASESSVQSSRVPQAERRESSSSATGVQKPSSESSVPAPTVLEEEEFREWKRRLLDKCVEGLNVCLSRFPTHYKSLYRLAYLYYASDTHRNLEHARDLLLGNSNWIDLQYMPANGLFSDRRTNNFFNGMWKIPIDEIDRCGSFASHVNRSVQLLLEVLRDLGDVQTLLQVQSQLKKKPLDQGRKYLRDGERHILAQMAHSYTLDAVAQQLRRPPGEQDRTELLLSAFRAYNSHRYGGEAQRATMLLITAYQRMGLPKHGMGSPLQQAMQYCTTLIASQALAQKAERARHLSQSSASLYSPSSSHPHTTTTPTTSHTDAGTTPLSFPPPRPLTPGQGVVGQATSGMRGQSSVPSPLLHPPSPHPSHHSSSAAVIQTSTSSSPRPPHLPTSRPRTMSGSRAETHFMHDPSSAMNRQHSTSSALDLSLPPPPPPPTSQKTSSSTTTTTATAATGPRPYSTHKTLVDSGEVIDLTSPEKSRDSAMGSPRSRAGVGGWGQSSSVGRGLPPQDYSPGRLRLPGGVGPPRGSSGPASLALSRGGGNVRSGGFPDAAPPFRQGTPPHRASPASPFSSPHQPFSSAPSTPTTPRPHTTSTADEVSDLDLISDLEEELALTSPDKLTSDVRHHFHGDLM